MKKIFRHLLFAVVMVALFIVPQFSEAQSKVFTIEELSQYDGQDGQPAYAAFEGKVYDFSSSKLWIGGKHFELLAGRDLTEELGNHHGKDLIEVFPVVGVLEGYSSDEVPESMVTSTDSKTWFQGRFRFLGITILGWTGILLGVFFVLTFASCFAMPWAKLPVPWKGTRPGVDEMDRVEKHLPWTSTHKYFVWFAIIFGIIHGVIGFLQLLGIFL